MSYTPPQAYSLVRNNHQDDSESGINLQAVQLNPLTATQASASQYKSSQVQVDRPAGIVYTQPTQQIQNSPLVGITEDQPVIGPPNQWNDGICDWPSNLFPSCFCACCFCGGMYILAQMAHKTGFMTFKNTMNLFLASWVVGIIFFLIFHNFLFTVPSWFVLVFTIYLRMHIVRKYEINNSPCCGECCCAFCCTTCAIAQMARHVYGYKKVLDGDGDPDRPDSWAAAQIV